MRNHHPPLKFGGHLLSAVFLIFVLASSNAFGEVPDPNPEKFALLAQPAPSNLAPVVYLQDLYNTPLTDGDGIQGITASSNYSNPDTWEYYRFCANAGDTVTIETHRTTSAMDPGHQVCQGVTDDTTGLSFGGCGPDMVFIDSADDNNGIPHGVGGSFADPRSQFVAPVSGEYTLAVFDVLPAGSPPEFEVHVDGVVACSATLWGISLNGYSVGNPGPSSLYQIDQITGAGTLVGSDLGYAVNSIAVDPTTGIMYASTTTWSGAFNGLLSVDTNTGIATEIGSFGSFTSILGLTFDSSGQLWGWHDPGADDPVRIDKATGAATTVGDAGIGTAAHVLAFDASDTLILIQDSSVYNIDQVTGLAAFDSSLGFDPGSGGADFAPDTDLLWNARGRGRDLDSWIRITDVPGATFTDLDTDVQYLNALTFGGSAIAVNTPPVAVDDPGYGTLEDTILNQAAPGVLGNDTDAEGDPLTASLDSTTSNGSLTLNADGSFDYDPDANFCGLDSFTYHANDGEDDSNIATVTITVTCVNDPPVANDDAYNAVEDTPLNVAAPGVLANDTDVEGDPLTAVQDSSTSNGGLTLNADGSFEYIPDANYCGSDSFTYHANDGVDDSNIATVTITVECVNDAPVANDDAYDAVEDTPLNVAAPGVLANDTDVEGDALSAVLDSTTSNGGLTLNADGSFTYTPNENYCGLDSFTYHAAENSGLFWSTHGDGTRLGTIDTNDATEVDIGAQGVSQSWAAAFDTNGDLYGTYNGFSGNAQLAILDQTTGGIAATIGGLGVNLIALEVDAGGQLWGVGYNNGILYRIDKSNATLTPVGNTGIGATMDLAFAPDGLLYSTVGNQLYQLDTATGAVITTTAISGIAGGAVMGMSFDASGRLFATAYVANSPLYQIDPGTGAAVVVGPTTFFAPHGGDIAGSGSGAISNIATVTITVECVNDAPVAVNNNYTGNEDTQQSGNVIVDDTGEGVDFDVDGDGMTIFSNTNVAHGILVLNADGSFTYDPNLNYCGPDSFDYVLTDDPSATPPSLTSNTATVSITVVCVNDPPTVTSVVPDAQTSDYSDYIGTVVISVNDVDNVSTTLAESNEPPLSAGGLSLTSTGCSVINTESPNEDGSDCTWSYDGQVVDPGDNVYAILFTASDGDGAGSVTGTHTLTIVPEEATVVLDSGNDVALQVAEDGGNSGPFLLHFTAVETTPDLANIGSPQFGNLNEMVPLMTLVPVGPGGPIAGACSFIAPLPLYPGAGYGQVAYFECAFDEVPVNTYEVIAQVDGASDTTRYYTGEDDAVLVIFDPSLGFTTGGGWFYWPGTADPDLLACGEDGYAGDKTNFGFNMKYNKKRTNVQGSLLLQRHTVDANCEEAGKFRVKSNALDGLSIGDGTDADGDYGWAAFSGKSVFSEPGLDGSGNHPFLVYVEDHTDEGGNQDPVDEFWIQVKDKDGIVVLETNGPDSDPAGDDEATDGDDVSIENGNIIVPHGGGGGGKGPNK